MSFTISISYTKCVILYTLQAYAKSGKLTKEKERLLSLVEESRYNSYEPRYKQTEFDSTPQYRVYVMNEIIDLYESTLKKADKYKWLPFLEHELYICYQNLIANNLNL